MAIKIEKPIVDYRVVQNDPPGEQQPAEGEQAPAAGKPEDTPEPGPDTRQEPELAEVVQMHEQVERPPMLRGSTYKIKTPQSEHAMYVTINDIILNEGT